MNKMIVVRKGWDDSKWVKRDIESWLKDMMRDKLYSSKKNCESRIDKGRKAVKCKLTLTLEQED